MFSIDTTHLNEFWSAEKIVQNARMTPVFCYWDELAIRRYVDSRAKAWPKEKIYQKNKRVSMAFSQYCRLLAVCTHKHWFCFFFTRILSSTRTGDIHTLRFMILRHHTHTSIHQNILDDTLSSTAMTLVLFFLPVRDWWHFACRGKVSPSNLLQITLHGATHAGTSLVSIHISIYSNDFPFLYESCLP